MFINERTVYQFLLGEIFLYKFRLQERKIRTQQVVHPRVNLLLLITHIFLLKYLLFNAISLAIAMHLNLKCFFFNYLMKVENILVLQ